jgi:microcystin-dependent protein
MEPYIGQISAFGFSFAPEGWVTCQGQQLSISQYETLFSLIGTVFGGNGVTTFAVPDLRGRTIIGVGQGAGLSAIQYGQVGGTEGTTLLSSNLPAHSHQIVNGDGTTPGTVAVATTIQTVNNENESGESNNGANVLGTSGNMPSIYRENPSGADCIGGVTSTISGTTSTAGASSPFGIRNPYLGVYYCIATEGVFPTRG